ncbi:MAG: cyanophycin synthetase [Candidatus Doudnabacteria bacterium]|nr:cyanophycin synthetase [Candidatus Doudnabacteria bacterium]
MKKPISPLLGRVLKKIAPRIGAQVVLEPEWNYAGQVVYKNGRKRYFRYSSLDLNPLGASEISKDKSYANFFMGRLGYPIIKGQTFFSGRWTKATGSKKNINAGFAYARRLGFPVIVKPNSQSQGIGVCKAHNKQEFYRAMRHIFKRNRVAIVQKFCEGKDYRVVVLDGKIISAYRRIPLSVVGDGKSSIRLLLTRKQKKFVADGRDTQINADDFRILQKLKTEGLSMRTVLPKNRQVFLLDNANLSSGGDAVDVTNSIHPQFKKLSIKLTRDMGLRLCGVDLLVEAGIENPPGQYWILETNAAPGLDHYVLTGKKQQKIVEDMYLEVLKAME